MLVIRGPVVVGGDGWHGSNLCPDASHLEFIFFCDLIEPFGFPFALVSHLCICPGTANFTAVIENQVLHTHKAHTSSVHEKVTSHLPLSATMAETSSMLPTLLVAALRHTPLCMLLLHISLSSHPTTLGLHLSLASSVGRLTASLV